MLPKLRSLVEVSKQTPQIEGHALLASARKPKRLLVITAPRWGGTYS